MEIRSPSRTEILNHHLLQPDVITESRQGACFDLPRWGRTGSQSYVKGVAWWSQEDKLAGRPCTWEHSRCLAPQTFTPAPGHGSVTGWTRGKS